VHLAAVDADLAGRLDAEANGTRTRLEDGHDDATVDDDGLVGLAGEDQHEPPPA
jgi:hypothetical protein